MLCKKDLLDIRENTESKLVVDVIDILLDQVDNEEELDLLKGFNLPFKK